MHLAPHMCKIVTLKANAQEIVTCKMHFDAKYAHICYCEGKCSENCYLKMNLAPNMLQEIITLNANVRKSSLLNAFGTKYVQNHYFEGKCSENHHFKIHLVPQMCKTITLQANAKEIIT